MSDRVFVATDESSIQKTLVHDLISVGLDPFILSDVAEVGAEFSSAVLSAVRSADAVLLVLTKDSTRSQLFDAGIAYAMHIPVIVLALDDAPLPPVLKVMPVLRSNSPTLIGEAIRMARRKKPAQRTAPSERPIGAKADELAGRATSGNEAESLEAIAVAIEESGAIVVRGREVDQFDLAVWSDDLASVGANPLFVELVKTVKPQTLEDVAVKLGKSALPTVAIVVYLTDSVSRGRAQQAAGPSYPVLFVSAEELIDSLRAQSFAKTVRSLRNNWVHGVNHGGD
ncbi:hypothetical protein ABC304_09920 [Microbacterium sp. 1P10UB]|uniref:hypothetical protein n=1 Tax=unclassified Microbacterium TaxID=2609290 RepID=UPI0039A0DB95